MGCIDCNDDSLPQGKDGLNGSFGGFSGRFQYNTAVNTTGINSSQLRLNNNSSSSVNEIYISNTGINSIDYTLFLDSFNNSGNFGYIRIFKEFDDTKFWMGKVTNIVNIGSYHTLTVSFITASNITIPTSIFVNSENLILSFAPTGLIGSSGANVLYNDVVSSTMVVNPILTLTKTFSIAANQLSSNGDYLELRATYFVSPYQAPTYGKIFDITINNVVAHTSVPNFDMLNNIITTDLLLRITRVNLTTLYLHFETICGSFGYNIISGGKVFSESGFNVSDLSLMIMNIGLRTQDAVRIDQVVITYFKKQ